MAVAAWQKSKVLLLALHKVLHFSEVKPWWADGVSPKVSLLYRTILCRLTDKQLS